MADYKGQTRTVYTNAQEAAQKAQAWSVAVFPVVEQVNVSEEVKPVTKGKRKA